MLTVGTSFIALLFCANGLYILASIIYSLFFHPLAKFPGPKLAACTKLYQFYYDLIKWPGGQFMWEIRRLHEIYGPIVRITPDELHISDPEFFEVLHCAGSAIRDKYPSSAKYFGTPLAAFGTVDHGTHRMRRAPIMSYFSKSNVRTFEPSLRAHVGDLSGKLGVALRTKDLVDLRLSYLSFTTDLLYLYAYAEDLGLRNDSKKARAWMKTMNAVAAVTPIVRQIPDVVPWLLRLSPRIVQYIYPSLVPMLELHKEMRNQAFKTLSGIEEHSSQSYSSAGKVEGPSTVLTAILNSDLPKHEKSLDRLSQEAFVLMGAGSDTPARTLVAGTCYLLANPSCLQKLQEELDAAMPDRNQPPPLQVLEKLPYLSAVIKEIMRLLGLVTTRLSVICPQTSLQYKQWSIPAGTPVSMTLYHVLHDPSIFPNPSAFKPSRWLSDQIKSLSRFYVPFGRGHRMCAGQSFALAELYIAFATIFRRFELQLKDTVWERDVKVVKDNFVGEAMQNKGVFVSVLRERL